ncbi:MAG: hypothetical protein Q8M02_02410 [Candidatus Didemnitutus sp.]|nr:hypothetical protein [Candidatus Didemnitutus sp.]
MKLLRLLLVGLLWVSALHAASIKVGPGALQIDLGMPVTLYTYRPVNYTDGPIILVFHGVNRNAENYRNNAIAMAERFGAIVVAPEFDKKRFPSEAYQRGGITRHGKVQPPAKWTYAMIPQIAAAVRANLGKPELRYYCIGHSAGGQFVARMAALTGALGAERLVSVNPGSHLFPTRDAEFGYGFGGLPDNLSNEAAIRRYLAAPLTIYLGTADTKQDDPDLDRSAAAMKQGRFRYERGLACFAAAKKLAEERGWAFNWELVETAGIGHNSKRMFSAKEAQQALFGSEK